MSDQKQQLHKPSSLHEKWRREKNELVRDPSAAWRLAKNANGAGEHLLALEITEVTIAQTPDADSIPLRQQKSRALTALGSTDEARQVLEAIPLGRKDDSETLGLLGRVFKDLAAAAPNGESRQRFLSDAQKSYQRGFERARDNQDRAGAEYCGINAATMAALLDDKKAAEELARETLCFSREDDNYYSSATRAEARLILGDEEEASRLYRRASQLAEQFKNWGDLASTKKQCRALSFKLYGVREKFDPCFPLGRIAIFVGHMPDEDGRSEPRFPGSAENAVQNRIIDWIASRHVKVSYSSAASGSDILFLEAAQAAGIETHVLLPFAAEDFVGTSVRPAGESWVERFRTVLSNAASQTVINDQVADEKSAAYDFTNRMIAAKAALRANDTQMPVAGLAVWDNADGDGAGGTADAVAAWCRAKIDIYAIHPTDSKRDGTVCDVDSVIAVPFERTQSALPRGYRTTVCAVLHLYFEDYYRMREQDYPLFQEHILIPLAELVAKSQYQPESSYGLGADYAFVFDRIQAAGAFAGEVQARLTEELKSTLNPVLQPPRIALHAGPMFLLVNPVLNQYSHEGSTLTRAARMARYLAPGIPFSTEPFAALSALEAIREFRCQYAGSQRYPDETRDRLFRIQYRANRTT
jgi:pilus assembly protein FimV